jgi:hypothetical protein
LIAPILGELAEQGGSNADDNREHQHFDTRCDGI